MLLLVVTRQDILINNAAQTLTRPDTWTIKMYSLEEDAAKQLEDKPDGARAIKLAPPPHVGMSSVTPIQNVLETDPEPEPHTQTTGEARCTDSLSASGQINEVQQNMTVPVGGTATTAVTVARRRDGSAIAMDESGQPLDLSVRRNHLRCCCEQFTMLNERCLMP